MTSDRAGLPADPATLVDVGRLLGAYYDRSPDPGVPAERVAFGTSGHRGSSLSGSFNEAHILATTQAICDFRRREGTDGPLFIGRDTHALSEPAFRTAIEVRRASTSASTRVTAGRRRRRSRTRSSSTTGAAPRARPTGSSSRRPTTRPRTAASSTTRHREGRRTPR
jgi:hypothetical protein